MGKTILEMIDIKKSFSGIYALSGINFSLEMGEVHALLGENGAGKSTLIKVLGGIYKPDSGTIKINGQEAEINGVSDAQEKGIGIIHQEIVLVPYLTVAQNLFLGREIKTKFGTVDMRETNRRAGEMLANLGVNIHPDTLVESLTIAQQQMVEIVKAVSFDGRIIVMDEPTSSLSNDEVEQLFGIIERLKAKQVSIIYISHRGRTVPDLGSSYHHPRWRLCGNEKNIGDECERAGSHDGRTGVRELLCQRLQRSGTCRNGVGSEEFNL